MLQEVLDVDPPEPGHLAPNDANLSEAVTHRLGQFSEQWFLLTTLLDLRKN